MVSYVNYHNLFILIAQTQPPLDLDSSNTVPSYFKHFIYFEQNGKHENIGMGNIPFLLSLDP